MKEILTLSRNPIFQYLVNITHSSYCPRQTGGSTISFIIVSPFYHKTNCLSKKTSILPSTIEQQKLHKTHPEMNEFRGDVRSFLELVKKNFLIKQPREEGKQSCEKKSPDPRPAQCNQKYIRFGHNWKAPSLL